MVLGGEEVTPSDVELYKNNFADDCLLVNGLGPTESTVSLQYFIDKQTAISGERVPVGYPVDATEVFLISRAGKRTEMYGEIAIKSEHVALGYWRNAETTAAAFSRNGSSARIYRTGDMGRRLADGSIVFAGRKDLQVKIRGVRVEPGEIESALTKLSGVRECAVIATVNGSSDRRLVAYVVPGPGESLVANDLRSLKEKLPDYMVPSAFVVLDELPLTSSGKLNRRALSAPEISDRKAKLTGTAPRTPTEKLLAEIWGDVLGVADVGIHENFFELGGHSLKATQVISRIREAFQVDLPLRLIFEEPTIVGLAEKIEMACRAEQGLQFPPILPVSRDRSLPLSFAQQRLWFLDQLEPNSPFYSIPLAIRLKGPLDEEALEQSLNEIVRRHESLRTTFVTAEGEPLQMIKPELSLTLSLKDLRHLPETEVEVEAQRLATEEAERPFDLASGPLMRTALLRLNKDDHILLLTMHHIISDGWSIGILTKELTALYEAFTQGKPSPLPDLAIQYADYAVWQREWLQGEVLEKQLSYWRQQLAGAPAALELPTDKPRPAVQTFRGAYHRVTLPKELSEQLKALAQHEGVTLYMLLLAAFQVLLSRHSGQHDIVVGTDVANRTQTETENLIGFFVNLLPMRTNLADILTFQHLLKQVREMALGAYAHQDLPFEKLVEHLQPERDLSRNPLVQVLFVFQNTPHQTLVLKDLNVSSSRIGGETSRFDLVVFIRETEQGIG